MSTLEIIAVMVSLIGVGLTIKRHVLCWLFNIVACILYAVLFYEYLLFGEVTLQVIFVVMNIYGYLVWIKTKKINETLVIETLSPQFAVYQVIGTCALGGVFGLMLQYFTKAAVPLLDAQLAAFSLLATYWTSQKYIATWILWIVVDTIYVAMFIYKNLHLTAGLYAAFTLMAGYGWYTWAIVKKQQMAMR
ncbi:nicotinamide riboside transporter PnuC [Acinetobacter apis]|uniref:Nicotinamide riboside transporter PnuC n=1 Tax=Acinetobacter apis TaxID=1229165 RepID=A0A217EG05_9GAMM|nr:nicotinamide riboside transporter PnuC [Acinetobacter apis]SNQ29126.1 nicotinamide mononucleotide transporter [Acinetobacter apis]